MSFPDRSWPASLREMVAQALKEGATVREGRHRVLGLTDGRGNVVFPRTPSDRRTLINIECQLRRALSGHYKVTK